MTQQTRSWFENNINDILKWVTFVGAIIYAYAQLNSQVSNLKEIRLEDKNTLTKSVDELKVEVKGLRQDILLLIKESRDRE